jgi:hypothetical protein
MSHVQLETAVQHEVVLAVLTHLQKGEINEATAYFGESFRFNDYGIELEFTDSRRLADFLSKPVNFIQTPRYGQRRCL